MFIVPTLQRGNAMAHRSNGVNGGDELIYRAPLHMLEPYSHWQVISVTRRSHAGAWERSKINGVGLERL